MLLFIPRSLCALKRVAADQTVKLRTSCFGREFCPVRGVLS
jgi:hypothetical protein